MSGLQRSNRQHGKWLIVLTLGFLWAVGVIVWNEHLRPKKENCEKLWQNYSEIKNRIEAYEEGIKLLYNCCESAVSSDIDFLQIQAEHERRITELEER